MRRYLRPPQPRRALSKQCGLTQIDIRAHGEWIVREGEPQIRSGAVILVSILCAYTVLREVHFHCESSRPSE